jgi:phage/plasmid-like protein (TIGR03299 family)
MAHEIRTFAHAKSVNPWHGLGNHVEENQSLDVWANEAGFNYTIDEAAVKFRRGDSEHDTVISDRKALYNGATGEYISLVGDGFKVVQPREVLEFFRDLTTDMGYKMRTAGVLRNGAIYFALAETPNEGKVANQVHKQFVLFATGCDGSLANTAGLTDVCVVCNNTLRLAVREDRETMIKVKHSTTFDATNAKQRLKLLDVDTGFADTIKTLNSLAKFKMSGDMVERFYATWLTDEERAEEHMKGTDKRAIKGLQDVLSAYALAPGAHVGTAYGALQGATFYVDHVRGKSEDKRLHSSLFTQGAMQKERALNMLNNMLVAA